MPRIPTQTATLTTPVQRTGDELSIASGTLTGAAMHNLGHELQRAGAIGVSIADQRAREIELRYAADAGQRFTEESIRFQQENGNREDSGELFKAWSDKRIAELEKEAPNNRGAQVFKHHVLPQANSDWRHNLARGEAVRLSNFKVGEEAASQGAHDAMRFRYLANPAEAQALRVTDLRNQLARINTAYGEVAPAHALAMNESAVVSAVLGAAEHNPGFARALLNDFPLVDIPKRETLLAHIEAREESQGQVGRFATLRAWESQQKAAWENLIPLSGQKDYAIFGKQADSVRTQQETQDKIVNEAIMAYMGVADRNGNAQQAALEPYIATGDPNKDAVGSMLMQRITENTRQQQAAPHLHLIQNNPVVQEAQSEWETATHQAAMASDPVEKAALLANARSYRSVLLDVSTHFQGYPPAGADKSFYLYRNTSEMQVITPAEATSYADAIMKGGAETADQAFMEFAASVPPEYLGQAWNNLSMLPAEGHQLPPDWQIASTIANPLVRKRVLGAAKYAKDLADLTPERRKSLDDAFESDVWRNFGTVMVGDNYQRSDWVNSYKKVVMADAIGLMTKEKLSEKAAVKKSLNDIITAQWSPQMMYNGRPLLVPRQREDWTAGGTPKPERTEAELDQVPGAMHMSLYRLPTTLIPTSSLAWLSDVDKKKRGDPEVESWIQKSIVQSATWKMEPDGQSYSLYIYDKATENEFQLVDANSRPFVVPIDRALAEQSKDIIQRQGPLISENPYLNPPPDLSGPRTPSEVPPLFESRRRFVMWPGFMSWMEATKSGTPPMLGGEWINQQPGMGLNPSLDKVRSYTEPRPKPPAKPVK